MSQRIATNRRDVPFLAERQLEEEALVLLAEYCQEHGETTAPPIPVDEIVEIHLELTFELRDMPRLLGHEDIHGAIWINQRLVGVDQSLDPSVHPNRLGRFRFTLAHEVGHWCLHRQHYLQDPNQKSLLPETVTKPAYICRSTEGTKRVEWQANYFAACLLMPRKMVNAAWEAWRGNMKAVALDDLRSKEHEILTAEIQRRGGVKPGGNAPGDMLLEHYIRPLAEQFQVSPEAMRIRLEQIKLLVQKKEPSLFE